MAAPKQSGHMNTTDHAEHRAPSSVVSQSDSLSPMAANTAQHSARSALPLVDSVAYDPCPSSAARWTRALSRAVPASLALLGALALGSASSIVGPADHTVRRTEQTESSSSLSWTELARVARMQLVAADAVYAPQVMTGAASELSPDGADQGGSRSERMRARKEAAEARRAAAKERREAAKQARLEARQARKEARMARKAGRDDEEEDEEESSSTSDRREAYAERRAAAKEKREAAAAARREAAEERRSAYAERKAAAKEKRAAAAESRHAALQDRREAAKARREEKLAARREAVEARRAAKEERKEERLAAREDREERGSRSEASPTVSSGGSFGRTETAMAPASGAALLRINSRPWAQVYVDGRLVGNTPQLALQLPPGEHNVRLVNGVFAMGKVLNVKLRAGERVTRVEMLEE